MRELLPLTFGSLTALTRPDRGQEFLIKSQRGREQEVEAVAEKSSIEQEVLTGDPDWEKGWGLEARARS